MKIVSKIKEIYKLGLRWSIFEQEDELFTQVVYIGLMIIGIATLWNINYHNALICTCMILIHLLSMYIIGYIKQLWEGSILEGSHKEEFYQKLYFALNIILCGATTVITRSFIPLLLIFIPTIGAFLIIILWQLIFRLTTMIIKMIKKSGISYSNEEKISLIICYSLVIIPVAISVLVLPIFIAWKIFILFAFIISIPLIVVGADNGMNFIELFSIVK